MLDHTTLKDYKNTLAAGVLMATAAISTNLQAQQVLEVSHLNVSYLSASSSSELLSRSQNKGLDFLNKVETQSDPTFCNKQVQGGLKVFETLVKLVPGTGTLSDLIKIAGGTAVASTCRGAGGLSFTWDEIMREVDKKIDLALTNLQRQQMRDLFGYFSLEFESRTDRLLLAEKGELSQADLLILIAELSNIIGDIEQAETMFSTGNEWTQVSFLPHLYALKYSIHLVLVELFDQQDELEQTAFDHLNLQMEQSRIRAIQGIVDANKHFARFVSSAGPASANYRFKKSRKGFYSTWRRTYSIRFTPANGDSDTFTSSCHGNPCSGISANTWYSRRDRNLRSTAESYEDMWQGLFESRDESYRDFVDSVNYFKGQQLFFVAGNHYNNRTKMNTAYCLQPAANIDGGTSLTTTACSFGEHERRMPANVERDSALDSWRVHDKTGLVINESTGLCLDLADNKTDVSLSACEYNLDPEREERSTQEWAILEQGMIINRNTGDCLITPDEIARLDKGWSSRVQMRACDSKSIKKENVDLGVAKYSHDFKQAWQLLALENCNDENVCTTTDSIDFNMPTRRAEAKKRLVIPADTVDQFNQQAVLDATVPGFTDTGFLSFSAVNDHAKWQDLEVIAGKYRLTIIYQGVESNDPIDALLKLEVNDQPIVEQINVPAINAGEKGKVVQEVNLPDFSRTLALSSVGSEGNYLIDKLILTPISED